MTTKDLSLWLKKHPFGAVCAGLSVVLLGAYFFRQGSVPSSQALLAERASESQRLKSNIAHSASLKDDVAALEEANKKIADRLVRPADVAKNQQYFYKIEADTGVKLMDLRSGAATAPSGKPAPGPKKLYTPVAYSCTVQGTYTQLLTFLRKLDEGEHFSRVLNASISTTGPQSGTGESDVADPVLTMVVSLELFGQS